MRIERSVRHTRAVDRRKVIRLEEDMGLAGILRSGVEQRAGGRRRPAEPTSGYSQPGREPGERSDEPGERPGHQQHADHDQEAPETPAIQA